MQVQVPASKIHVQDITDPGPGEHLWVTLVAFKAPDEAMKKMAKGEDPGESLLDHENMLTLEGPGCYKCEEPFSKRTFYRKCTGSTQ